jgi:hypothetical protein
MIQIDSKHAKQVFIWKALLGEIAKVWITHTEVSKRLGVAQSGISSILKWKLQASDDKFRKIWKAIWIDESLMEDIIFEWKKEALKYEYPERYAAMDSSHSKMVLPQWIQLAFSKAWELSNTDINKIINFIEFTKSTKK